MDTNSGRSVWSNRAWAAARLGGAAGGAAALGAGAVWVGGAAYFARRVVTPDRRKPNDQEIRAVRVGEIDLAITPDSTVPGRYGLWIGTGDDTHVRIGDVLSVDEAAGTVTRELIGVDFGELVVGPARWDQYFFGETPQRSLGLPTTDVLVRSDIGEVSTQAVYDVLRALTDARLLRRIQPTGSLARYEPAARFFGIALARRRSRLLAAAQHQAPSGDLPGMPGLRRTDAHHP